MQHYKFWTHKHWHIEKYHDINISHDVNTRILKEVYLIN